MKKAGFFLVILLSCFALFSCKPKTAQEKAGPLAGESGAAPGFTLKDLNGRAVSLSEFRGKVLVLEFWATWCPPCKATIPELNALRKKYDGKGVEVVGISVDDEDDLTVKLSKFARDHGINYTVLVGNEDVEREYNVNSIPTLYLIGKDGKIRKSYMGYMDNFQSIISAEIERIL